MSRQSSIDALPEHIRDALHALLQDPAVTQLETCKRVNELLKAEGDEQRVSKSAVNRYSLQMQSIGKRLRESREIAAMWVDKIGHQPQGQIGKIINEMLRSLSYEVTTELMNGELTADSLPTVIEQLNNLSLATIRLEKASSESVKREKEIRAQLATEAADKAEQAAVAAGLTTEAVTNIKNSILGIT